MPTPQEKADFSERLKFSMTRAPEKMRGATDLALHFNLRYHGEPVSPQTTHKWLTARSIPTVDKLQTLAEWFKVDQHWLHYGPPPSGNPQAMPKPLAGTSNIRLRRKRSNSLRRSRRCRHITGICSRN